MNGFLRNDSPREEVAKKNEIMIQKGGKGRKNTFYKPKSLIYGYRKIYVAANLWKKEKSFSNPYLNLLNMHITLA